ncbi:DNA-binding response regulator [Paenibacillus turpanensis]|uniref:DNA-binding response regulator n=1 Tax=Paenibacillus turpanensis TaxID=2689078 RepID=UPI001FB65ED0|nr:DNA-binding response regulator [Paenibacillus turpanensis]
MEKSEGERQRRLQQGLGHAETMFLENVWWPLFHSFHDLYPEYEVIDFDDGARFLDFAYLRAPHKLCIEIDGFGPHWKNTTRWQFADHLHRQLHLTIDGWVVVRFSFDDVKERPRRCQGALQQLFGKLYGSGVPDRLEMSLTPIEREIVRFAISERNVVKAGGVMEHLGYSRNQVHALLRGLAAKGVLVPAEGGKRIRYYQLQNGWERRFR